jgi:crossover junction endodeoxyribonuclease RusA
MTAVLTTFRVAGLPAPQGSKRAMTHRHTGKTIMVEQSGAKLKAWREVVAETAAIYFRGQLLDGPVRVKITFWLPRPASATRAWPSVRPDVDKLARAVLDPLTGVAFADDSQVCELDVDKRYCQPGIQPGAVVSIWQLGESDG